MWETPIYRFNQEAGTDADGNLVYKQVVIDVTRSAPTFATPGKALAGALDAAVAATGVGPSDTILDFGAGKLRNTIYLLEQGHRVCAVEFAHQFESSQPARENLARAESEFAKRFSRLVYPDSFEASELRFKLILLINVINIMPVAAERDYVLTLCNQRLAEDGRLLWYTQRGDQNYQERLNDRFRLGDGVYVGRTTYHKTFYREFEVKEIDGLLHRAGFEYDCKIEATWRNQSRLYRKTGPAVLAEVLDPESIKHARVSDESIPDPQNVKAKEPGRAREKYEPNEVTSAGEKRKGRANPEQLTAEAKLIEALANTEEGEDPSESYGELIRRLFEHLFADALYKLNYVSLPDGSAFRDLMAENRGKRGFFHTLREQHVSRRIIVRCRNRRHTKREPAFDGLSDGMDRHLAFGFLAYRGGDRKYVTERCRRILRTSDSPTAILPLDDNDLATLLRLRMTGATGHPVSNIDDFLGQRLLEVTTPLRVFLSYSRKDSKMMKEVREHLAPLEARGTIDLFVDLDLRSGQKWQRKIEAAVAAADVGIFLISSSSLASKFVGPHEVDPLLERATTIIPVLLRQTALPARLTALNILNRAQPVQPRPRGNRDEVWTKVVEEIHHAFDSLSLGGG